MEFGLAHGGAALGATGARITFGWRSFHAAATPTAGGMVRTGPWPGAIALPSPGSLACAALVSAGAIIRMLCEEHLLIRQYPEYADYARTTSRVIPYVV
jgi:protein-S-isoprenylcysteine O-methyltransferase Ste14